MFAKPYKIKSTNTLKNVEKKQLHQKILDQFQMATEENCKILMSMKSTVTMMKLVVHGGDLVEVYVVDGEPMFLDMQQRLLPTLYALWKVPALVPTLIMHTPVLSKLQGGAQLYQPGVVVAAGGAGLPLFARGAVLAACTADNGAAAVVGVAAAGSADLLLKVWSDYMLSCVSRVRPPHPPQTPHSPPANGSCLEPLHVYGDLLCKEPRFSRRERPSFGPAAYGGGQPAGADSFIAPVSQAMFPPLPPPAPAGEAREAWPRLSPRTPPATPAELSRHTMGNLNLSSQVAEVAPVAPPPPPPASPSPPPPAPPSPPLSSLPEDMDGLLRHCLLLFLKYDLKNVELPLKTNLLYRNHLVPYCPEDRILDVKKSSYKKLSKFLEAMQQEGLVEIRELERGVDALVSARASHPAVTSLPARPPARARARARAASPARPAPGGDAQYSPPQLREMYCVTAAVLPLFTGYKKGAALTAGEVRATLTQYVKSKELTRGGMLALDTLLANICSRTQQETIKWEDGMTCIQNKMTVCTEMRFADGTVKLIKSRLEPIKMQVATRSGNKKVTLVSNLESYGLSLPELSKSCQAAAATSCGVTRSPGARADQLMLQGDQTYFIAKLLIEKYGFPKKYVEGADKALKKKNK